jgi:hypothetical protein
MDVLSALLSRRAGMKEGVDYLEQETLAAVLVLVEKIQVSDTCRFAVFTH